VQNANFDLFGNTPSHSPVTNHVNSGDRSLSPQERLAILETRFDHLTEDLDDIKFKLDELITLKQKGLGAFWLVGLLISTGIIGFITTISGLLNRGHL
jgi:hypothetical protein